MDFCSEMRIEQLRHNVDLPFKTEAIIPEHYYRILTRIPWLGRKFQIRTFDITFNYFLVYPQTIKIKGA